MTLLLAVQVAMHAKHNGIQKSEQEKRILYFAEDTVNLIEIYPLPSTEQGPDSISFVAEQSSKMEPSLLVMMIKNARNTIASRMPASSVARTDSSGEWRGLELRVKKAQEAWNITDADLKKLSN